jgi:hypothetical protein
MSPHFYHTGYSRYFYEYWLPRIGFTIVDIDLNGNFFEYVAQELRRVPTVGKDYAAGGLGLVGRMARRLLLRSLARMSEQDTGSSEVLTFGLHVLAKKEGDRPSGP